MIKFYYLLLLALCISFVYAQPPNDQCVDAITLSNTTLVTGTNAGSTTTGFEICQSGQDRDVPVFYEYT